MDTQLTPENASISKYVIRIINRSFREQGSKKLLFPAGIALVLFLKLLLIGLLYHTGFESLTADEFSRTTLAASWAQHPSAWWYGPWLPFHLYMLGIALRFWWDLLWVPRILTIILGSISIVLMYQLTRELFDRAGIALLSAILLALNPAHFWLSAAPLAEMPHATLVLAAMLTFVRYLKGRSKLYLFSTAALLAAASGFRFESWMVSLLFSLVVTGIAVLQYRNGKTGLGEALLLLLAAGLPWIFPLAWVIGNYQGTGDPFYFLNWIRAYKLTRYGENSFYGNYARILFKLDPFATAGALAGLVLCLRRYLRSGPVRWYACVASVPFLVFIYLHGGQPEPEGNYYRYLAFFLFLMYPAVGYLLWNLVTSFKIPGAVQGLLLILVLGVISIWQLHTTFNLPHNTDADSLQVGRRIQALRQADPTVPLQPVLIERVYWQFLVIDVGANDVSTLFYDRPQELQKQTAESLFLAPKDALMDCISQYHFGFFVVKSPNLRQAVEDKLDLAPVEETAGYAFYKVPARQTNIDGIPPEACHLNITLAQ